MQSCSEQNDAVGYVSIASGFQISMWISMLSLKHFFRFIFDLPFLHCLSSTFSKAVSFVSEVSKEYYFIYLHLDYIISIRLFFGLQTDCSLELDILLISLLRAVVFNSTLL